MTLLPLPLLEEAGGRGRSGVPTNRAGLPATVAPAGTSCTTTLPAPTIASAPIVTPGRMMAPPPIQTIRADADRAAELPGRRAAMRWVTRVVGGIDLHRGADLCALADLDGHHVQDHAAEIEERVGTEADVGAVIAVEGRPDHRPLPHMRQAFGQDRPALRRGRGAGGVVACQPGLGHRLVGLDLRRRPGRYSAPDSIFCFSVRPVTRTARPPQPAPR